MLWLETIKHKDITRQALLDAISVKQTAWPFPIDSQENWISKNIRDNDIHCFLKESNKIVAYMNLVDETVLFDDRPYKIWGVGNVCSAIHNKGYGNALMQKVNNFIVIEQRIGLLLCHEPLLSFYLKNNWIVVDNAKLSGVVDGVYVMNFNCNILFKKLNCINRNF